jgi:hypothetical protein
MAVSAKFKVNRRVEMDWATEVELTPDYAQGRNADWASATPAGMIRLTIKNELAAKQFKEGQPVDILFSFPESE